MAAQSYVCDNVTTAIHIQQQQTHANLILNWQIKNNYINDYVIISLLASIFIAVHRVMLFHYCFLYLIKKRH